MREQIRFQAPAPPSLAEVAPYYEMAESSQWYSNFGPCHEMLVDRVEAYVGQSARVLPVANATLGLIASLVGVLEAVWHQRRLIVVPSFTFAATGTAVAWAGYEPLFVDVSGDSWQMDSTSLAMTLEQSAPNVAGILACSTFGTAPSRREIDEWESLASKYEIPLVVDSAAGFGSAVEGRPLGTQGDVEVFSLHATKPLAVGEGGLISSTNGQLIGRLRQLINFGFDDEKRMTTALGINAKMSEIQAAFALAALDRHDDVLSRRRSYAKRLSHAAAAGGLRVQTGYENGTLQFLPLLAESPGHRSAVEIAANSAGVETRRYFDEPLHVARPWFTPGSTSLAMSESLGDRMLCFPMYNVMTEETLQAIETVLVDHQS